MLYTLIINSILCFIFGYLSRSVIFFHTERKKRVDLQVKAENGEYMPIVIVCDLNDVGGYTVRVCNMRGVHALKENHDKFRVMLRWLSEEEKKRHVKKYECKVLKFKKDI